MEHHANSLNVVTQNMLPRHLSQVLTNTAARFPDKEAIVFGGERITWSELQRRVETLAGAFLGMGVQRGDRVGILCTTRPEYIVTYLAAARVGAMLVGFNVNFTVREIKKQAEIAKPTLMVVLRQMPVAAQLQSCFETMPGVRHCIAIGEPVPTGWWRFEQLVEVTVYPPPTSPRHQGEALAMKFHRRFPPLTGGLRRVGGERVLGENQNPGPAQALAARAQTLGEDDGALMVFTGGVTGMPKGAVLSHKNIIANIAAQNRNLDWRAADRVILHLPMNHVSGATLLTVGALMSGVTLVMLERFHPERALAAVQRERVTIFGQVPAMWIMELSLPNFVDYDLSSVRMTIVSGAPTPDETMRSIAAIAPIAHHVYGLTEAAGMVTHNQPGDDLAVLLRAAGQTNPEFELRIVDGDRKPVGPGQEGEIAVRGDCVMTGYFGEQEETAHVIDEEGWLYTGDLGRMDENGYLTVTGLIKEMYFSGGYNVYPAEVEAYLDQHPDIEQSACSGVPHPIMGETGEIWVVPRAGVELSRRDIRAYCKAGLARYKRPTHIHIVDALP